MSVHPYMNVPDRDAFLAQHPLCTADHPLPRLDVLHPDATFVQAHNWYRCPYCGLDFQSLP